jgi:hypothetical protein
MITTEAWVLHRGPSGEPGPAELKKERFTFPDIMEYEVLAEPIYGSWEGNMTHALARDPVDVCRQRCEEKVVLGNAGVVRALKTGCTAGTTSRGWRKSTHRGGSRPTPRFSK